MKTKHMAGATLAVLGLVSVWGQPAAAQSGYYDPRYERGYDRGPERERYDREPRERRDFDDRRGDGRRGYDERRGGYDDRRDRGPRQDGYGYAPQPERRGQGYGPGPGGNPMAGNPRAGNPTAGMTIDEQKQALKNHREAQKKAIKRGYVIP